MIKIVDDGSWSDKSAFSDTKYVLVFFVFQPQLFQNLQTLLLQLSKL